MKILDEWMELIDEDERSIFPTDIAHAICHEILEGTGIEACEFWFKDDLISYVGIALNNGQTFKVTIQESHPVEEGMYW